MATTQDLPIDPQLYRETLAQLKLRGIHLHALNVECHNRVGGEIKMDISTEARGNHESGELSVDAHYTLKARNATDDLFTIDATFVVLLGAPEELPNGFFEVYIANNLAITVFPYFRELVNSLTSRMGLPPLTLPYTANRFGARSTKPKPKKAKSKAAE